MLNRDNRPTDRRCWNRDNANTLDMISIYERLSCDFCHQISEQMTDFCSQRCTCIWSSLFLFIYLNVNSHFTKFALIHFGSGWTQKCIWIGHIESVLRIQVTEHFHQTSFKSLISVVSTDSKHGHSGKLLSTTTFTGSDSRRLLRYLLSSFLS